MRSIPKLAALVLLVATALPASAQTALLSFDDIASGTYSTNFLYNGYIFSPRQNFKITAPDATNPGFPPVSQWIGVTIFTSNAVTNPGYLGDPVSGPLLYVTRQDGRPFTLEGLTGAQGGAAVSSSKGGYSFLTPWAAMSFSGPEWTAVQWLGFGGFGGAYRGFDNLVVTAVPEPAAAWLLACGLAGLGVLRGRRAGTAPQLGASA